MDEVARAHPSGRWGPGPRVDAALGAATALVVVLAIAADLGRDGPAPPAAYAFAAGFGALMLVRRRYPVPVLVASGLGLLGYYALGFPPIGLALPVGAALYSAAEAGRLGWAIATSAALVAVSSTARTLGGEDPRYLFAFELPTTVAVMAAALALGDGVRSRRLWRAEVLGRAERERRELQAATQRRLQDDRLALARDVHDVLAHTLSVVTLHADVASEALQDGDTAATATAVTRIRDAGGSAGRELRRAVRELRGSQDPAVGPVPTGPWVVASGPADLPARLADLVSSAVGPPQVSLRVTGAARALPVAVRDAAHRVVQEALTNARRHAAGATRVDVVLSYTDSCLAVRVVDDGTGGATTPAAGHAAGEGHGLRGMRERARLLGGTLLAGPLPRGGFRVDVTLPIPPAA